MSPTEDAYTLPRLHSDSTQRTAGILPIKHPALCPTGSVKSKPLYTRELYDNEELGNTALFTVAVVKILQYYRG